MEMTKKEATSVELAALLMEVVCTSAEREESALSELAGHLGLDLGLLQSELMFLRAFVVDFVIAMTLGQTPMRRAILMRFYHHWERLDQEVGSGLMDDLQDRLTLYGEAVGSSVKGDTGLSGLVGGAFAQCCHQEDQGEDLALLGASMLGAFFEELAHLFESLEVVLMPGEGDDDPYTPN